MSASSKFNSFNAKFCWAIFDEKFHGRTFKNNVQVFAATGINQIQTNKKTNINMIKKYHLTALVTLPIQWLVHWTEPRWLECTLHYRTIHANIWGKQAITCWWNKEILPLFINKQELQVAIKREISCIHGTLATVRVLHTLATVLHTSHCTSTAHTGHCTAR